MKIVNEELDRKRKEERRKAKKIESKQASKQEREQIEEGLKNSKYILLRNKKDLDEEQMEKL